MLTRGPGLSAERRARKMSRLLFLGAEEVGLGRERSGRGGAGARWSRPDRPRAGGLGLVGRWGEIGPRFLGWVGKEGPCRERESGPAEVLGWVGFWVRFGFWVLGFLSLSISFPF